MRAILTPGFRRAWLGNLFSDLSFALFFQFSGFLSELGVGEAIIGATASVAAGAAIVARPRAGHWMDTRGRIPVVRIASLLRIGAVVTLLFVDRMGATVYVARAVFATGVAVSFTGLFTYASDVIPTERRTQAIAYYGLSGMTAAGGGPMVGDALVSGFGFRSVFVAMLVVEMALLAQLSRLHAIEDRPKISLPGSTLSLLRFRPLVPVWVMMLGFGLGYGGLINFLRTFVDAVGIGRVGPFFAVYSVTAIVVRLTLSSLPDRLGEHRMLYPAAGLFTAGIATLTVARSPATLAAAAALAGAGHAFLFPVLTSLVVARSPMERRGAAMSLYTAMFDLGPLVGAPALGFVAERWGYSTMWPVMASAVAVAAIGFTLLDIGRHREYQPAR